MENLRQKLKIFNYRPLVLIFLGLIAGILVANFILEATALTVVCIILSVFMLALYSVLHKTPRYVIIMLICFVIGFGVFKIYISTHKHKPIDMTDKQAVGEVVKTTTYDNCLVILL